MTGALVLESDLSGVDASFNDVSANMFYGDISGLVQVTDVGNAGIQYLLFTEQSGVPAGLGSLRVDQQHLRYHPNKFINDYLKEIYLEM